MNASKDWLKFAVCLIIFVPVTVLGGESATEVAATPLGEVVITDQPDPVTTPEALPVDYESVLVHPPIGVEDTSGETTFTIGIPCARCGTSGCVSCSDAVSRTRNTSRPGWHTAAGYFSRVLGDASPRWVGQVDALMLWQGNIASRPLYVDGAGLPVLNVNQAQPPMTAGPRFALFLNVDPVSSIEGNYFNVQSFNGEQSPGVTAGGYVMNNLAGLGFGSIDWARVTTTGQIQSAELNWRRRPCGSPLTWLAGFRWVEWNQSMRLFDLYSGITPGSEQFDALTGNDLYGGQMGADLCLWNNNGPVQVNGIGKAGIFYNSAYQRMTYTASGSEPLQASAVADQTAFFGELGANASVRLTNWLSWRAGYSLFWLSGVATPAAQLSTTDIGVTPATATINTNGSVLLHGVTTGLEARW